jgi:peptidoglycan lytic transglycosylase
VSPRTSIGSTRAQSARSRERASERRQGGKSPRRQRRTGWRRWATIGGTLLAGAAVGLVVANSDKVQDALREVTLPLKHEDIIRQQAHDKDVPADLIAATIYAESRFRDQTSSAGARGLMQITPDTANEIERLSGGSTFKFDDLADPDINIRYGTFYLHELLNLYDGNEVAAIAAYNAGPTKVSEWGGADLVRDDIEIEETRDYVDEVLDKRDEYRSHYADELGL